MDYINGYHKLGDEAKREIAVRAALEIFKASAGASTTSTGNPIGSICEKINKNLDSVADSIQESLKIK